MTVLVVAVAGSLALCLAGWRKLARLSAYAANVRYATALLHATTPVDAPSPNSDPVVATARTGPGRRFSADTTITVDDEYLVVTRGASEVLRAPRTQVRVAYGPAGRSCYPAVLVTHRRRAVALFATAPGPRGARDRAYVEAQVALLRQLRRALVTAVNVS